MNKAFREVVSLIFSVYVLCTCAKNKHDNYIIGGSDADFKDYRWMVSVQTFDTQSCGGILIQDSTGETNTVITGFSANDVSVGVGSSRTDELTIYNAQSIKIHELYDPGPDDLFRYRYAHDIALINLTESIPSSMASPAILANSDDDFVLEQCNIAGWGRTNPAIPGNRPVKLLETTTRVINNSYCEFLFMNDPDGFVETILPTQMCTLDDNKNTGACDYDDGGPVKCSAGKVAGIMSYWLPKPFDDCARDYPNVHTRISDYIDWISNNT